MEELHAPQMETGAPSERPDISPASYAMGWMVDTYRGHRRVHHGGAIDGFIAAVTMFPDDQLGIVCLANKSGTAVPELLVRHAADMVLGLPAVDWTGEALAKRKAGKEVEKDSETKKELTRKTGTKPAHALAEYVGQYENPGYGVVDISLKDGALTLAMSGMTGKLDHWHYETFNVAKGASDEAIEDQKLQFVTNMAGDVESLRAPLEPAVDDIVFTRKPDAQLADPTYIAQFVGTYKLGPQEMSIEQSGSKLTCSVVGQTTYELAPLRDDKYSIKGVGAFGANAYTLRFLKDPTGKVKSALFDQPNGVFEAQRVN
jgi:hypothetical protein